MARARRQTSGGSKPVRRSAGGTATISASVSAPLVDRLDAFVRRTKWQQSRVIADALELYTELPPVALQRMTELSNRLGEERLRTAVARAVEREIDRLEWAIVAQETARELEGRFPAELSEEELVRQTEGAIAASRRARRSARVLGGDPTSHTGDSGTR